MEGCKGFRWVNALCQFILFQVQGPWVRFGKALCLEEAPVFLQTVNKSPCWPRHSGVHWTGAELLPDSTARLEVLVLLFLGAYACVDALEPLCCQILQSQCCTLLGSGRGPHQVSLPPLQKNSSTNWRVSPQLPKHPPHASRRKRKLATGAQMEVLRSNALLTRQLSTDSINHRQSADQC